MVVKIPADSGGPNVKDASKLLPEPILFGILSSLMLTSKYFASIDPRKKNNVIEKIDVTRNIVL